MVLCCSEEECVLTFAVLCTCNPVCIYSFSVTIASVYTDFVVTCWQAVEYLRNCEWLLILALCQVTFISVDSWVCNFVNIASFAPSARLGLANILVMPIGFSSLLADAEPPFLKIASLIGVASARL